MPLGTRSFRSARRRGMLLPCGKRARRLGRKGRRALLLPFRQKGRRGLLFRGRRGSAPRIETLDFRGRGRFEFSCGRIPRKLAALSADRPRVGGGHTLRRAHLPRGGKIFFHRAENNEPPFGEPCDGGGVRAPNRRLFRIRARRGPRARQLHIRGGRNRVPDVCRRRPR